MTADLPRRTADLTRSTNETKIQLSLSLDGGPLDLLPANDEFPNHDDDENDHQSRSKSTIPPQDSKHHASQMTKSQEIWIWTGIGFLDHMLHAWAKHAGWSLRLRVRGDLSIDDHHTTEDTHLALGAAFRTALGPRTALTRFAHAYTPLDEALARAVLDISSRPFFLCSSLSPAAPLNTLGFRSDKIGEMSTQMVAHGLQSWAMEARVTLHVDVIRGDNDHHRAESVYKAVAVACRGACARVGGREGEVGSTKGVL